MKQTLLVMDFVNEYIYGDRPLTQINKRKELISTVKRVVYFAHQKEVPVIYINSAFRKEDPIMKIIGHRP